MHYTEYTFPSLSHITPTRTQVKTWLFGLKHERFFNFNDLGLGKTLSTLWTADYRMLTGEVKQCLVLTPLSTVSAVWAKELNAHLPHRRFTVITGSMDAGRKIKLLDSGADFIVCNHDAIRSGATFARGRIKLDGFSKALRAKIGRGLDMVVSDESTVWANSTSQISRLARVMFADEDRLRFMCELTATPTLSSPVNAHGLRRAMFGGYTDAQGVVRDKTMIQVGQFKWVLRPMANAYVAALLQPAVRFERCVDDLPPNIPAFREAPLGAKQRAVYEALKRDTLAQYEGKIISAMNEGVIRLKLLQASMGAVYADAREGKRDTVRLIEAGASRVSVLKEVMETYPGKFIVFAPFTSVLHMLHDMLNGRKIGGTTLKTALLYGAVNATHRKTLLSSFTDDADGVNVIIADARTMAHGLTLLAAKTVIWYGPTDNPETWVQANARNYRTGQTDTTYCVCLYGTAYEKAIYDKRFRNESDQGQLMEMLRTGD